MIIDCAQYLDGERLHRGAMSLQEAAARRHSATDGGFIWLGLFQPSVEELDQVREAFDLHELAVEDARTFHMRPKIERYGDGVDLVILRTARYDDAREEVDFGEISVFVGPDFVIAVRQGVASELAPARARLEGHPELLRLGTGVRVVGDPRPGDRRVRAGRRGSRTGHRPGRGDGVRRRRGPDRTDLPAPSRGHELLPGSTSAAGSTDVHRTGGRQDAVAAVLPRRHRRSAAGQRGGLGPA